MAWGARRESVQWLCVVAAVAALLAAVAVPVAADSERAHCHADIDAMLKPAANNMTEQVLKMHQATGKGTWSFTPLGTKYDMGNWPLCMELDNTRYCSVYSDVVSQDGQDASHLLPAVGACVPNTCDGDSLSDVPRAKLVKALGLPFSPVSPVKLRVECKSHVGVDEMPWGGYLLCAVLTMFAAVVVVATVVDCQTQYDVFPLARTLGAKTARTADIYDVPYNEDDVDEGLVDRTTREFSGIYGKSSVLEGSTEELAYLAASETVEGMPQNDVSETYRTVRHAPWFEPLMSFSAARNTGRLIAPPPVSNTAALNGIRVLSMCWVVLGHTYVFIFGAPILNPSTFADSVNNFRFHLIYGGFFAVDSFFLMSGFLVAYLFLAELKKKGMRPITMPLFYFHRLWRLWPTVIVGTLFYWLVMPYIFASGPFQPVTKETVDGVCKDWWATLLFINNFLPSDTQCAGWLWYLANDMQFFILSPIVLLAYWKKKLVGVGIAVAVVLMCILANMLSAIIFDLDAFPLLGFLANGTPPGFSEEQMDHQVLSNVYMLPWTRCAPYAVGMLVAFALLERQSIKAMAEHNIVRYTALSVAAALLLLLTFVTYTVALWGWTKLESMIWLGFSRTSWAIALGIWMYYLSTGHCGAFNRILSHDAWIPFARLSFGTYIYHLIFMTLFYSGFKAPIAYQLDLMLCFYLFNLIGAYFLSYINYIILEKPLMNYEKMLLTRLLRR